VLAGLLVGIIAASALTRIIVSRLYGISPMDPLVVICALALLGAVAMFACWFPARRALRIDPMEALRCE
jgi:putative ABC transport system permease protein